MSFKLFFEYLVRTDGRSYIGMIMSLTGLAFNIVFDYIFCGYIRTGNAWSRVGNISLHYSKHVDRLYLFPEIQPYKVLQTEGRWECSSEILH